MLPNSTFIMVLALYLTDPDMYIFYDLAERSGVLVCFLTDRVLEGGGVGSEGDFLRTPAPGRFAGSNTRGESGRASRWNLLNSGGRSQFIQH